MPVLGAGVIAADGVLQTALMQVKHGSCFNFDVTTPYHFASNGVFKVYV